jgi:Tol biopolymer transport system component
MLKDKPASVTELNPNLPRDLSKIIRHCLVKDREDRYQTAKDLRYELKELKREVDTGEVGPSTGLTAKPLKSRKMWLLAGALAVVLVFTVLYIWIRSVEEESQAAPIAASFSRLTTGPGQELHPSLSPDGKSIAIKSVSIATGTSSSCALGGHNPINLTKDSPADDIHPAFSPDGESIAFRSEREGGGIFVMGATGESVRRVLDFGYDPAWSPDGEKIAVATIAQEPGNRRGLSELWVVDQTTGSKTRLATPDKIAPIQPQWSPHGHRIAYHDTDVWTMPAGGAEGLRLTEERGADGVWSADGRYIYFSSLRGEAPTSGESPSMRKRAMDWAHRSR